MADREGNAELRARFDDVYSQYGRLREGLSVLQQNLAGLEATVRSPDGMVVVVVGARGELKRLTLHEKAYGAHPPERLAKLITQTTARATGVAAEAVQQMMRDVTPPDSGVAEFMRSNDYGALLRRHDQRMGYDPSDGEGGRR
jgi:DNA-binding protein YbaB